MTEAPTEPPMKDENANESVRHPLDFCAIRAARQGADFENNPFAEASIGVDHDRLTYRLAGLDFRLTGVEHTSVVKGAGVRAFS